MEALHRFLAAKGVDTLVDGPMDKHQIMKYYQEDWDAIGLPERESIDTEEEIV